MSPDDITTCVGNKLHTTDGPVASFSSHAVAFEALMRLGNSTWRPLNGGGMTGDDLAEFRRIGGRSGVFVKQYYYKVNECKAPGWHDLNCICWHDVGTGPHAADATGLAIRVHEVPL